MERVYYHFLDHCRCKEFGNNICSGAKLLSDSLSCLFSWRELPSFSPCRIHRVRIPRQGIFLPFILFPFEPCVRTSDRQTSNCLVAYLKGTWMYLSPSSWMHSTCPIPANWADSLETATCLVSFSSSPGVREFKDLPNIELLKTFCSLDSWFCLIKKNKETWNEKGNFYTYTYVYSPPQSSKP